MQTTTTFATLRRSARQLAVAATLGMAAVGAQAQTQTQAAPAQQQQAAFGIDSFVNAVTIFDDYILITFNYKEGETRIDFADIESSDLQSVGGPKPL